MLLVLLILGFNFERVIHPIIGIHMPAILVSAGITLLALLYSASGLLASALGTISILTVFGVNCRERRQAHLDNALEKLTTELAAKLDVPKPVLRPKPWGLTMPRELDDAEKFKLDLELQKFAWQKTMDMEQKRFINRNFGVIITAIVSIAAVTVSSLQLKIASNNARDQLENERLRNDRQFYLEITKFLLDRQQQMTTTDKEKVIYLRSVVMSSFPPELALQVASRMRQNATTNDIRKIWDEAITETARAAKSGIAGTR
jgi:hypothetical protein